MTLKERYLEENIVKTLDRAINSNDYERLKDELQMYRAQNRMLKPEIEALRMQYNSVKNSPQGPALKLALDNKERELKNASDTLAMYKDQGRQGLGMDPQEYQLGKAEEQGMVKGGLAGGATGLAAGLVGGHALFGESTEMTFSARILEEAGYDMNNLNTGTGIGKKQDFSKPAPYKNYSKPGINLKGIHADPNKITSKIDNYFRNKGSKVNDYFKRANQRRDWIGGVSRVGNAAPSAITNAIGSTLKGANNFLKSPAKKFGHAAGSVAMGSPLITGGLGVGALGYGLNHLFGDGDEEIPEVEAPEVEVPTEPMGPPEPTFMNKVGNTLDKFPGGKLGAGAAGLGAAGLAGIMYDRNKNNR